MTEAEKLDAVFSALANPTRRAILARLAEGEATVNALAEPFNMSLPAISKHIRVLENAELKKKKKNAQFRPCRLNAKSLQEVANWAEQYSDIWSTRFETMDKLIQAKKDSRHD